MANDRVRSSANANEIPDRRQMFGVQTIKGIGRKTT